MYISKVHREKMMHCRGKEEGEGEGGGGGGEEGRRGREEKRGEEKRGEEKRGEERE